MKLILTLLFAAVAATGFSQRQNVYFFKNNGTEVTVRDSADYIRVVREPDSGAVNYKVSEYYKNLKPKLVAESSTVEPLTFENVLIAYYPNGKKSDLDQFKNGKILRSYTYYDNGKLQSVRDYPDSFVKEREFEQDSLVTYNDTTGKPLIVNAEGYYAGSNIAVADRYEEGKIVNGRKDGEWKGAYAADKITFTELYKNGRLVSGTSITADGKKYTYTTERSLPDAGKGRNINDLSKGLYVAQRTTSVVTAVRSGAPMSAVYTQPRVSSSTFSSNMAQSNSPQLRQATADADIMAAQQQQGQVKIAFLVDKTGAAKNFTVQQSLNAKYDQIAMDLVAHNYKGRKDIKPGILLGRPVDTPYVVPVNF